MKKCTLLTLLLLTFSVSAQKMSKNKKAAIASVEKHKAELIKISDAIWAAAETAFEESESSKILADYAEKNGLTVERGVADIPTAFTATYGSGKPVISILGEFDALPGISQKAQPEKEPYEEGAAGHGCGHNMFGTSSLGAAIAIKELMEAGKLKGTIKFLGTPAEEKFFAKVWMEEAGLWNDVDVNLSWHLGPSIEADVQSGLSLIDNSKGKRLMPPPTLGMGVLHLMLWRFTQQESIIIENIFCLLHVFITTYKMVVRW